MYRLVMAIRPDALPTDPAALTEIMLALDAENEKVGGDQTLKETMFGKRSERLAVIIAGQLALEPAILRPTPRCLHRPTTVRLRRSCPTSRARGRAATSVCCPSTCRVASPCWSRRPSCARAARAQLHKIGEDVSEVQDMIPAILRGCCARSVRSTPGAAAPMAWSGQKVLPRLIESGMASTVLVTTWWSQSSPGICRCTARC